LAIVVFPGEPTLITTPFLKQLPSGQIFAQGRAFLIAPGKHFFNLLSNVYCLWRRGWWSQQSDRLSPMGDEYFLPARSSLQKLG
jgi:hypothetical protein